MMEKIWIRIAEAGKVQETQRFILSLLEEELGGNIPVSLYAAKNRSVVPMSHVYDLSEKALIPLYEKFGEENVKLKEQYSEDEAQTSNQAANPLDRIAVAMEGINQSLEVLAGCVGIGGSFCIAGDVITSED